MANYPAYQISAHDCGPASVINGLRCLFERREIPPELIRMIYSTALNEHGENGEPCRGTDREAMRFLSAQLNEYAPKVHFPLETKFLAQKDVTLSDGSEVLRWVRDGGLAVMRIWVGVGHYVLITDITDTEVFFWDPWLEETPELEGVTYYTERRTDYNIAVSRKRFERYEKEMFMMSEEEMRNTLLMRKIR